MLIKIDLLRVKFKFEIILGEAYRKHYTTAFAREPIEMLYDTYITACIIAEEKRCETFFAYADIMKTVKATLLKPNIHKKEENESQNMIVQKYFVVENLLLVLFTIVSDHVKLRCDASGHAGHAVHDEKSPRNILKSEWNYTLSLFCCTKVCVSVYFYPYS